jgi:hypothetical protein
MFVEEWRILGKDEEKYIPKDRTRIKRKTVAFDTNIPLQQRLFDFVNEKENFSDYVRTLVIADMLTDGALANLTIVQQKEFKKKYNPKDFEIDM